MIELLKSDDGIRDFLPIMGQKGYISAKSSDYGWFKNEEFAVAFIIDKHAIFKRLIFMSGVVSLKGVEFGEKEEKNFLNEVIGFIKERNLVDFINKAHSNVVFKSCPEGADCVPWGTHVVEIDAKGEELLKKFKKQARKNIKRAIRDGVVVEKSDDCELIYNLIKDTMQRQNSIHYPSLEYIKTLKRNLKDNALFYISKYNNEIQGCAIVIYDKKRAYSPYSGSIKKPKVSVMHLLDFQAMEDMYDLGVREYDFVGTRLYDLEGSKFTSIAKYKMSFNPKIEKGYTFKYIINPLKYKLFILATKSYLKLKGYNYIDPIEQIKSEMSNPKAVLWQE